MESRFTICSLDKLQNLALSNARPNIFRLEENAPQKLDANNNAFLGHRKGNLKRAAVWHMQRERFRYAGQRTHRERENAECNNEKRRSDDERV